VERFINPKTVYNSQVDLTMDNFCSQAMDLGIPERHLLNWNVGCGENGQTLFFYRDKADRFTNCKEIVYGPGLHRNKAISPKFTFTKGQGYSAGLFGEHNLKKPGVIILVESEKTAILCDYWRPEHVWLATGGASGMTRQKAEVLRDRKVRIAVDSDKAGRDNAKTTLARLEEIGINAKIVDLYLDKQDGFDLADYLIDRLELIKKEISGLNADDRERFEERAAILEYDAEFSKYKAEMQSLEYIKGDGFDSAWNL
jgi:hypothetical protein